MMKRIYIVLFLFTFISVCVMGGEVNAHSQLHLTAIIAPRLGFDEDSNVYKLNIAIEMENCGDDDILVPTRGFSAGGHYDSKSMSTEIRIMWNIPRSSKGQPLVLADTELGICRLHKNEVTRISFDCDLPKISIGKSATIEVKVDELLMRYKVEQYYIRFNIRRMDIGKYDMRNQLRQENIQDQTGAGR